MIVVAFLALTAYSALSICKNAGQIKVTAMGGWTEVTVHPNGSVDITCGDCMDQVCYSVNEDGSYVIGTKCNKWSEWLNCPPNPNSPYQQVGWINAIFDGYIDPSNPAKGIKFRADEHTIEIRDYDEWCRRLPTAESHLTFFIGIGGGD